MSSEKRLEDTITNFCFNCGKEVPEKAKFCPACGENLKVLSVKEEQAPETAKKDRDSGSIPKYQELIGKSFTLLNPGDSFQGYTILKMINKDSEGIKYIAQKDNKDHVLKVFNRSSFQNVNTLYSLQMMFSRLNKLQDAHIAKVVEINQTHIPAYMAAEYVHGISLAEMKKYNPERLDEAFMRPVLKMLVETTILIRRQGLTITNLEASGIMLSSADEPIILSSGIDYEDVDEREDLFTLAKLTAQMLSQATFATKIYGDDSLREHKYQYINGVSIELNKILGECLHRNIIQRYATLEDLKHALEALGSVEKAEIWTQSEQRTLESRNGDVDIRGPKRRIEYGFWILVILVLGLIAMLFTTNIYSVIFGAKGDKLQYTGFVLGGEENDSLKAPTAPALNRTGSPVQTGYGDIRGQKTGSRIDPRRAGSGSSDAPTPKTPIVQAPKPGAGFVYVEPGIVAFGHLGDKLANSVSLSGFYIAKHEVTQAEWNRYMKPAQASSVGDRLPVDNVSWFDIAIYCNGRSEAEGLSPAYKIRGIGASRVVTVDFNANGYRLPTEAEWEIAAKAGELFNYSGSNDPTEIGWFKENSLGKIRTGGAKAANKWGLYDMTGNVSEWVWDWYDANYLRALPTFINPSGPPTGTQKVIRGGNVINGEGRALNILNREKGDPNKAYQYVGFRLVRTK